MNKAYRIMYLKDNIIMTANDVVIQLQACLHHLHDLIIFKTDADKFDLLTIACPYMAVFWAIFFSIAKPLIAKAIYGKPWLVDGIKKEIKRAGGWEAANKKMGLDCKCEDELIEEWMKVWPMLPTIAIPHLVGGAICIPSMLGLGDPSWASSLAVLGILSEFGREIFDIIEMMFLRLRYGPKKMPTALIVGRLIHHSLTCLLSIPLILCYREWSVVHGLCFDLQFGGGIGLVLGPYGMLMDVTKPKDLIQFKVINIIKLIVCLSMRGIHFVYLVALILIRWYNDKEWTFLVVAAPVLLAFTYYCCIRENCGAIKTYLKFRSASAEYEALPDDASEEQRQASMANLEDIARELIDEAEDIDPTNRLSTFLESLQEGKRKIDRNRRKSMPALQCLMSMRSLRLIRGASAPPRDWKLD